MPTFTASSATSRPIMATSGFACSTIVVGRAVSLVFASTCGLISILPDFIGTVWPRAPDKQEFDSVVITLHGKERESNEARIELGEEVLCQKEVATKTDSKARVRTAPDQNMRKRRKEKDRWTNQSRDPELHQYKSEISMDCTHHWVPSKQV